MNRIPAPILGDLDRAFALVEHEPDARPWLNELLSAIALPPRGQAVVLGTRLGSPARTFAQQHPNWLVTALDPSVALLSASLDAVRPAGLSAQLTMLQAQPTELPLPAQSVDAILGDFPLAHIADRKQLNTWATTCARALSPDGVLAVRVAASRCTSAMVEQALQGWSPPYRSLLRPVWLASFELQTIIEALRQAHFDRVSVEPALSLPHAVSHVVVAKP